MPQQPPVPLVWAIAALAGTSLMVLMVLGVRWQSGDPVLRFAPRRIVPWTSLDLFLVVLLYLGVQGICAGIGYLLLSPPPVIAAAPVGIEVAIPRELSATDLIPMLLSLTVANLFVLVGGIQIVRWRSGATMANLGFDMAHWWPDTGLGIIAFLAALLPVYAIQAVLTQFLPSQHPVVSLLAGESQTAQVLLVAVSAVLVAPIVEEFLFRGLLQGWLEAIDVARQASLAVPSLAETKLSAATIVHSQPSEKDSQPESNPYQSPSLAGELPSQADAPVGNSPLPRKWPVIVSSLAFALVHWGHGPDPIPLFVLALVLGYLYRQTHRLWPCIVLHMALNGMSLMVLWITIKYGHPPGN